MYVSVDDGVVVDVVDYDDDDDDVNLPYDKIPSLLNSIVHSHNET